MTELSAEIGTVDEETPEGALTIEPGYLEYLRNHGYPVLELLEAHAVESNSREMNHIVTKIETYDKPEHSDELDIVADTVEIWTCSCEDFQYNKSADVSDSMVKPSQCQTCQHIQEVSMVEKAKNDSQQTEIGQ